MVLKIWSDKKFLRSAGDVRPILIPFWGLVKNNNEPHKNRFDAWIKSSKNIFIMVDSIDKADIVIYPQDPTIDIVGFKNFQEITRNKRMIVFFNSDSDEDIEMRENSILFRTSVMKSKKKAYEFGLPGWSEDWGFLGNCDLTNPVVGFCGQDARPQIRSQCLNILENAENIKTNFIRKREFWGGWINKGRTLDHGLKLRREFIDNIKTSNYILCVRGGGNFSYRLYETMMSGRIPLFIDTDCLLPYDSIVDWNQFFPVVKHDHLSQLPHVLLEFHKKFTSKGELNNHQQLVRKMWEEYLSPIGFFKNMEKLVRF